MHQNLKHLKNIYRKIKELKAKLKFFYIPVLFRTDIHENQKISVTTQIFERFMGSNQYNNIILFALSQHFFDKNLKIHFRKYNMIHEYIQIISEFVF